MGANERKEGGRAGERERRRRRKGGRGLARGQRGRQDERTNPQLVDVPFPDFLVGGVGGPLDEDAFDCLMFA